jgi:HSP20 family protein
MLWPTVKNEFNVNPFAGFNRLENQLNRLFDGCHHRNEVYPAVNVYNNDNEIVLTAELPGYDKDEIKITALQDQITLEGTMKQEEKEEKGKAYHRVERRKAAFKRTFRLPFDAEAEHVNAAYKNGVLTVIVPKAEAAKPKKIEIMDAMPQAD